MVDEKASPLRLAHYLNGCLQALALEIGPGCCLVLICKTFILEKDR